MADVIKIFFDIVLHFYEAHNLSDEKKESETSGGNCYRLWAVLKTDLALPCTAALFKLLGCKSH